MMRSNAKTDAYLRHVRFDDDDDAVSAYEDVLVVAGDGTKGVDSDEP